MTFSLSGTPAPQDASSPVSPESAAHEFLLGLKTPCRLLIAYSGGGDSTGLMAALAACLQANPGLDVTLMAATVDHGLRPESAAEARAVGALCESLSIPHHILTWDGDKPRTGIQAAARDARYRLLGELAAGIKADLVVTAHNLDDQIETLAMRRARNPEADGGISRAVLLDRHIWIFRPFLDVRRDAIRDYLVQRGIGWVDDPSNDNEAFERVRVRKALGPHAGMPQTTGRGALAIEAADYLRRNVVIHSGRVAILDLSSHRQDDPAHRAAIHHLAAMIGGRTHLAGRQTSERIAGFLGSREEKRLTAERVVFDRRRHLLYITRERRSLAAAAIDPGATVLWDNRFWVSNCGTATALISARGIGVEGRALIDGDLPENLPGAVLQRIRATEPVLIDGRFEDVKMKPIIAQFDRFLPLDTLEIANALAFLSRLDHFPILPTR